MTLRVIISLGLLSAVIFCVSSAPRAADEDKPAMEPHYVAVCDYELIFDKSIRYHTGLDELKAGTNKAEQELQTLSKLVKRLEEEMKGLQPGSPDFLKLQQEATFKKHELQARLEIERSKFEEKRVALEKEVMQEIDEDTKQFAVKHHITLVLNQPSYPPKLNDLEATERYRKRPVLYANPGVDITPLILRRLNEDFTAGAKKPEEPGKRPPPDAKPAAAKQ